MKATLVILAGGKATRIGSIKHVCPKTGLLAYDQPLLIRQIKQALPQTSISKIVISTNKKNYSQIKSIIYSFNKSLGASIEIFENPLHKIGSLNALSYIIKSLAIERTLMSFGDIFFLDSPFKEVSSLIGSEETYVFGAPPFLRNELLLGGIIDADKDNRVIKISEKPRSSIINIGYRWNGLALFSKKKHNKSLDSFLKKVPPDTPEEQYFSHFNSLYKKILVHQSADFINVNTLRDLHLAASIRLNEIIVEDQPNTELKLNKFIDNLRKYILKKKLQNE